MSGSGEEKRPLLGDKSSSAFYFLPQVTRTSTADVEAEEAPVHEHISANPQRRSIFSFLGIRGRRQIEPTEDVKLRKVPVKVEPKVFFSNERTFLAWLHMSVTLASISIAIVAFGEHKGWSQVYGLLLLPVAIIFSVYSLFVYQRRATMIRRRDPGPYEDRVGPILLGTILMVAIVMQFGVKMYDMTT